MIRSIRNRDSSFALQRWATVIVATVLVTVALAYGAWSFVIAPANQQRFDQQVKANVSSYQTAIRQYTDRLTQPLTDIVSRIPLTVFEQEQPQFLLWLDEQRAQWLKQLPDAQTINVLSVDQVKSQTGASLSFIVIDIFNRMEQGESAWLEAAKGSDGKWRLHKVEPILGEYGVLQGVLYITYSLEGMQKIFAGSESHARVMLRQYIDNHAPLTFIRQGTGSILFPQKVVNISNSYWQLAYQPSDFLAEKTASTPLWFWLLVIVLPLAGVVIGGWLTRPKSAQERSFKQTVAKKEKVARVKEELPADQVESPAVSEQVPSPDTGVEVDDDTEEVADGFPHHIFRAYDIRGLAYTEFTDQLAYAIGQAVATEVLAKGDKAMVVGRDARTHSEEFMLCVIEGIIRTGCDVYDLGLVPTPLMNFAACQHAKTSSGLIVTASHNPAQYNGCKMVVKGETLVDNDIQNLKDRIIRNDLAANQQKGKVEQRDFSQQYINHITSDVAVMDGWRIAIDAGNGAASELAPRLIKAFSCEVIPLFCEFDGSFPNHDPDPSNIDNLSALISAVTSQQADIGFAFDGDGDRLMVVTKQGRVIWPDQLLMLFSQDIVARHPGSDVVFDIKSTQFLSQIITEHGGRPVMWKTGHSHIKAKMKQTRALLGGEFSGHIFFKERWFGFDDGLYAAARLLEILTLTGQTIDELLDELPSAVSTPEVKIAVAEEQKFSLVDQLIKAQELSTRQQSTIDGLRVDYADGWGLVRASNTAPALTLRFEAKDEQALDNIKRTFNTALNTVGLALPDSLL